MLPMIDRRRFSMALSAPQVNHELNALNHAVAMVGAAQTDGNYTLVCSCYGHARKYLEQAEQEEPGATFLGIHALQAILLTAWHEFKGTGFARAWMSLGRALRLAKALGLHRIDRLDTDLIDTGFQLPLPPTNNLTEIEERRRTLWVAFVLDAYAGVRTNSPMTFHLSEVSSPIHDTSIVAPQT